MSKHAPSMTSIADASRVLATALAANRTIDVEFPSKEAAIAFRFRLYSARTKEKKLVAAAEGIPVELAASRYDNLHMTIVKTVASRGDTRHAVRITPLDSVDFVIRDVESGELIEAQEPEGALEDDTDYHLYNDEFDDSDDDGVDITAEE